VIRRIIHRLIERYLRRCGGSFHTRPYGACGRYVVLMTEEEYHYFQEYRHRYVWGEQVAEAGDSSLRSE